MTSSQFLAHLLKHDSFVAMSLISTSQKPLSVTFEREPGERITVALTRVRGIEAYLVTIARGADEKTRLAYGFTDIDAFLNDLESYVTVMNTNSLTQ